MRLAILFITASTLCRAVEFETQIRPILAQRCLGCHGPKLAMHGLRLDSRAAALKGGESGVPAFIAGNSSRSLAYRYIAGLDKDTKMPPGGNPMPDSEIRLIQQWIDAGAEWPDSGPVTAAPVDEKFRRGKTHWSFQSVQASSTPLVKDQKWIRNPIDSFILAKLEAQGWKPAPSAAPQQLLRRIYLDLTGLPPTLTEQDEFAKNGSLDHVIENLLDRPEYGERWGRHWLDVVRYGESNGYERDGHKPQVWKYRDYVIRSIQSDKPFDRFLTEQIAGDELDSVNTETLVATGFHRLGPWDDEPADPPTDRFDQLDDIISTTSQAFLGLTIGCARCHNHKFEPLTASDYYSMIAVFNGLERPRNGRTELDMPVGTREELQREAARETRMQPLRDEIKKRKTPFQTKEKDWESKIPADVKTEIAALENQIEEIRKQTPDLPRGYFLHEPKAPAVTHLLVRGKPSALGPEVPPAVPGILAKQQPPFEQAHNTSGRRLSFAKWLASRDNPLTARVIVNRVWMWHFGEGLVRTPSDFGLMGQRPTHPELLDYLANRFIEEGWSIKKLHRLILTSNTWRMSKQVNAEYQAKDPENRLLWRMHYKRLEAEAIRDSMLAISGKLNRTMYGPSVFPAIQPAALEGSSDPDKIWKASPEEDGNRRSVYVFLKRSLILPMLDMLDLCDTARSAAQRMTTSVPTQALTLFNGDFVNQQAAYLAAKLRREAGDDPKAQIELGYRLALSRKPTATEMSTMLDFIKSKEGNQALEQAARVILNLNEFVYVD